MCKFRTLSIQIDHLLITIVFIIQQRQYLYKVKKGAMNDDFVGFVRLLYMPCILIYIALGSLRIIRAFHEYNTETVFSR